jgi:hypothetical protein
MGFNQTTTDDTDESNDEIRMSNDELMTKREKARAKHKAAVSSPPRANDNGKYRMSSANSAIHLSLERRPSGSFLAPKARSQYEPGATP